MALFAQVKVETVLAFVTNSNDRHHLAAMALYILPDLSSWLDYQLDSMSLMVVSPNF
jgi:hypothetical protein